MSAQSSQANQIVRLADDVVGGSRRPRGHFSGFYFFELPIELIFMILALLDNDGLYTFSLLNKWLHRVTLSMFLINNKFSAGSDILVLRRPPYDVLRGLRIALFVKKLKSVVVWCVLMLGYHHHLIP